MVGHLGLLEGQLAGASAWLEVVGRDEGGILTGDPVVDVPDEEGWAVHGLVAVDGTDEVDGPLAAGGQVGRYQGRHRSAAPEWIVCR